MKYGGVLAASGAEQMLAGIDLLDVRGGDDFPATREGPDDQIRGRNAAVDEEVGAGIDRGGVDSEVVEHCRGGHVKPGFGGVALTALGAPG